tara:strand:- start:234 stop:581 length:348 start_codon:yes stop_codon:yes gene_type:complete
MVKLDVQDFFTDKCFEMLVDKSEESRDIKPIETLIEDIKLSDKEIYRFLDDCADKTNEHISYIIFDMMNHYKIDGVAIVEPSKDLNMLVNKCIKLAFAENLCFLTLRYEAWVDTR